jgi:hypothetical protein
MFRTNKCPYPVGGLLCCLFTAGLPIGSIGCSGEGFDDMASDNQGIQSRGCEAEVG